MIDAVRVPTAEGLNFTLTWQFAFAARLPGQLCVCGAKSELLGPPMKILRTLRTELPVFMSVTVCVALVLPTSKLPKITLDVDRFATGPSPVPLPLSTIVCGLAGSESLMLKLAVRVPVALGLNVTLRLQLPADASPAGNVPQVFVWLKSALFAPMILIL